MRFKHSTLLIAGAQRGKAMRRTTLFTLLLLSLAAASCDDDEMSFANNWDQDVHVFASTRESRHIDLFHKVTAEEFDRDVQALRDKTGMLSDADIVLELFRILSKIGDSHTVMEGGSFLSILPYRVEWVSDGFVITEVAQSKASLLGEKITAINGVDVMRISDSLRTLIPYENESRFRWAAISFFRAAEVFPYFGFGSSADKVSLRLESGPELDFLAGSGESRVSLYDQVTPPLFLSNLSDFYWLEEMTGDNLLYIQYNKAAEMGSQSFRAFTDQVISSLESNPALTKVVVDLRLNAGGNSAIAQPLIDALENAINLGRLTRENIYLVIGRRTYSSGFLNAWDLHEAIDPVVVGEPTGGKPNRFGEVRNFRLPNSRLRVWYSTKYFERSPNNESTMTPDVLIEASSEDVRQGRDPVMEYILTN